MNTALLDPWTDAATLAARLSLPAMRLVVIVGAEAWCQSCRKFRPEFEALAAQQDPERDAWVWLDLEEHAEFLGDFIPDNLPVLISYKGTELSHALTPATLTAASVIKTLDHDGIKNMTVPDIRRRLLLTDWAI